MSMADHESPKSQTEVWLTPPRILNALGAFDLDPCASLDRPWPTAAQHLTIEDDGLSQPWHGRVWCNPPYGTKTGTWLERLADHGDGIGFIFARTETRMFHEQVWRRASAILFLRGRVEFCRPDGTPSGNCGGAPSCLVAYGENNTMALLCSGLDGHLVIQ